MGYPANSDGLARFDLRGLSGCRGRYPPAAVRDRRWVVIKVAALVKGGFDAAAKSKEIPIMLLMDLMAPKELKRSVMRDASHCVACRSAPSASARD